MILRIFQLEEWTLIIQKSTVIPPSPIVLFTMSWQLFIIIIMELSHLLHRCQHRSCRHQLHWLRSNLLGSRVSTRWASPHTGIYKKLRICLLSMHWAREEENRALLTCNLFGIWATELWLMDPQPVRQYFTFASFLVFYIATKHIVVSGDLSWCRWFLQQGRRPSVPMAEVERTWKIFITLQQKSSN